MLLVGDVASNMVGLGLSIIHEDLAQGLDSLARLSKLDFQAAVSGHGGPIRQTTADRFRRKWGR